MKILNDKEKQEIIEIIKKEYGITKIDSLLIRFGSEKIRIFSGNLNSNVLQKLDNSLRIEAIGLYAMKNLENSLRLTIDSLNLLKDQINKNIIELTNEQVNQWLKGNELYIEESPGLKVLKKGSDYIGCGKSTGSKITNFVPKERRIR